MLFVSTTFSVVLFYNAGVEKIDFLIISEADLCCYLIVCMNAEAKFQLIKEKCCPSVELLVYVCSDEDNNWGYSRKSAFYLHLI